MFRTTMASHAQQQQDATRRRETSGPRRFRDRSEAGRLLAERLRGYAGRREDVVALGLPRGGVPLAWKAEELSETYPWGV
jgi:hypothetical protein